MKRTKKTKISARANRKRESLPLNEAVALLASIAGIASLWFAIAYTDDISFQIHAATSRLLLADEESVQSSESAGISSSTYYEEVISSSIAPDVKKVFDTTPPVISDAVMTDITATAASIKWKTDEFSTSSVRYGRTEAYESMSVPRTHLDQVHAIRIAGLLPHTQYFVEVTSRDHDGNVTVLGGLTFVTLEAPPEVVHSAASASVGASSGTKLTCDSLQTQTSTASKRGAFALALFKALGLKANSSTRRLYADVPVAHPSFQAVTALQRAGLMQGYSSPSASRFFGADDAITPATKLVVIQRAQKKGLCR